MVRSMYQAASFTALTIFCAASSRSSAGITLSFDSRKIFFRETAQLPHLRVAVERVRIEIDLGIEANEIAALGQDERIDLEKTHVLLGEGAVKRGHEFPQLFLRSRPKLQRFRHRPHME